MRRSSKIKKARLLQLMSQGESAKDAAIELIRTMEPLDLAELDLNHPQFRSEMAYYTALASENLMFETCYLWCVVGKPPYDQAIDFGLKESDIVEYQNQWRSIGIEPTEIEPDWDEED